MKQDMQSISIYSVKLRNSCVSFLIIKADIPLVEASVSINQGKGK